MKPHTREFTAVLAAALVLAALAVVSLFIGSYPLSVGEIFDILTGKLGDTMPVRVFWQLRLPRMCMGLISGLSLGVAGGVYQIIFRNPLASPDLTGVASGSSLGAAWKNLLPLFSLIIFSDTWNLSLYSPVEY